MAKLIQWRKRQGHSCKRRATFKAKQAARLCHFCPFPGYLSDRPLPIESIVPYLVPFVNLVKAFGSRHRCQVMEQIRQAVALAIAVLFQFI